MRKPSNRFERCAQVLAWLIHEYPCGRPVGLTWVHEITWLNPVSKKREQCDGKADRIGNTLLITLSKRRCRKWTESTETLIHEYAHCLLWGMARVELHANNIEHSLVFDAQDRAIYRRFQSGGGIEESYGYEF